MKTKCKDFQVRLSAGFIYAMLTISICSAVTAVSEPWKNLFDGKTLQGWVQKGGKAKFTVENGQIVGTAVINTKNSFLCTKATYSDFILEVEVKVDSPINSGIQIRSNSYPQFDDRRVHGYQVEIDPSKRSWTGGIYEEAMRGWLYPVDDPKARKAFKPGQWNKLRIEAIGDRIKTWVNDIPAAHLVDDMTQEGFIGLQVHSIGEDKTKQGGTLRWRNIRIITDKPVKYSRPTPLVPRDMYNKLTSTEKKQGWKLLFDGNDFSQWTHENRRPIRWKIIDNAMEVVPKTGSIMTKQKFGDFKLHVEFNISQTPPDAKGQGRGNSGVYLQRRYEIQILDSYGLELKNKDCGAIYKFKAPDKNVCKKPGQWQSYDITFRAARFKKQGDNFEKTENARITVLQNGVVIHNDVELPNKTGLGQPEGPQPGPILLQNHENKVRFRNIRITPL